MADYRLYKEIQNTYQKISLPLLVISLITIVAAVCVFIYDSPDRELYYLDLVFAIIVLIGGCIGLIGALHKYKELPEGEFCCRAGNATLISPTFGYCIWFLSGLFLYGYYNSEDLSLGQVLFFGVFQTLLILFAMIVFFCSRVYGIVGNGDKYIKLGIMGQKEYRYSEIAYITTKWFYFYKAYNHEKERMFGFIILWPDATKLMEKVGEKVIV